MKKNNTPLAIAFLFASVFAVSALVWSAGAGDPLRTIPYTGYLEQNGAPVEDVVTVSFNLHDDATAGSLLHTESISVDPVAGRFSVLLGAGVSPIAASVFDAQELFVEVGIGGTALLGRQAIHAAPDAHRAAVATFAETAAQATNATNATNATSAITATNLSCPNGTLAQHGVCIITPGGTSNLANAAATCRNQGAALCSMTQLHQAQLTGFGFCAVAWTGRFNNETTGFSALVSTGVDPVSCGPAGLNFVLRGEAEQFAPLCCR